MTDLWASKKFRTSVLAALVPVVCAFLKRVGIDVAPETMAAIMGPLLLYVAGQSLADHGKEKAKVENGSGGS